LISPEALRPVTGKHHLSRLIPALPRGLDAAFDHEFVIA
jgi:hypothetical protein